MTSRMGSVTARCQSRVDISTSSCVRRGSDVRETLLLRVRFNICNLKYKNKMFKRMLNLESARLIRTMVRINKSDNRWNSSLDRAITVQDDRATETTVKIRCYVLYHYHHLPEDVLLTVQYLEIPYLMHKITLRLLLFRDYIYNII